MSVTLGDKFFITPVDLAAMKTALKKGDDRRFQALLRVFPDERNQAVLSCGYSCKNRH